MPSFSKKIQKFLTNSLMLHNYKLSKQVGLYNKKSLSALDCHAPFPTNIVSLTAPYRVGIDRKFNYYGTNIGHKCSEVESHLLQWFRCLRIHWFTYLA